MKIGVLDRVASVFAAAMLASCATAGAGPTSAATAANPPPAPKGIQVPLQYRVSMAAGPGEIGPAIPGAVGIAPFTEGRRGDPTYIGINEEDNVQYAVYSAVDVLSLVTDAFRQEFQQSFSPPINGDPKNAGHTIYGQLMKFWVNAGWTYHGSVKMRITVVENHTRKTTYDRVVDISAQTWGQPRSPANNSKVFLEALRRAIRATLDDRSFPAALGAPSGMPPFVEPPSPPAQSNQTL